MTGVTSFGVHGNRQMELLIRKNLGKILGGDCLCEHVAKRTRARGWGMGAGLRAAVDVARWGKLTATLPSRTAS